MVRTHNRDSHVVGGILDHSIRGPPPLPYHLGDIIGLAEGGLPTMSSYQYNNSSPENMMTSSYKCSNATMCHLWDLFMQSKIMAYQNLATK
jgi:hypothetical protein